MNYDHIKNAVTLNVKTKIGVGAAAQNTSLSLTFGGPLLKRLCEAMTNLLAGSKTSSVPHSNRLSVIHLIRQDTNQLVGTFTQGTQTFTLEFGEFNAFWDELNEAVGEDRMKLLVPLTGEVKDANEEEEKPKAKAKTKKAKA